jgi:hypothetical protein
MTRCPVNYLLPAADLLWDVSPGALQGKQCDAALCASALCWRPRWLFFPAVQWSRSGVGEPKSRIDCRMHYPRKEP